jgi:molecular chaperone GrpE
LSAETRGERLLKHKRKSKKANSPDTKDEFPVPENELEVSSEEQDDNGNSGEVEEIGEAVEVAEETPEIETEDEVTRLTSELEDVRDLVRRKHAEFENYRKRIERERSEFVNHASAELVNDILPVLDNLERALDAPDTGTDDRFLEGIEIVRRQFRDILRRAGLNEVEALGLDFDPHVHEAVGRVETNDHREGEILEVYQKGYFFKDRMLRPALVNVAQPPQAKADTDDATAEDQSTENEHARDATST